MISSRGSHAIPIVAYRLLLLAYPAGFRREFGDDMLQLFRDRVRASETDRRRLRRFLFLAFRDVLSQGFAERVHTLRAGWMRRDGSRPEHLPPASSHEPQARKAGMMDTFWQDVRYGTRALRRDPAVVFVAILSLALGIGANASIFSAVDVFMFRPLPIPEAHRLYNMYTTNEERGWTQVSLSVPDFQDYRSATRTLDIAVHNFRGYSLSGGDSPERLIGRTVSWNFFTTIGAGPVLGRAFLPEEETPGQHRVAILSDGLWHRLFGADPAAVGQPILLDGETYTVVGVLPPRFWFLNATTDIWTPMQFTGEENRRSRNVQSIARLRPGVTGEVADAEVSQMAEQLAAAFPAADAGNGARIQDMRSVIFDQGFRQGSLIASVAVAFVLLIACANVANLFLTRTAGREREIALRGALGAGRMRIIRQLLVEAVLVSLISGVAGLAMAMAGIRGLLSIMPPNFPMMDEIGLDGRVLLFAIGVSLLTGVLFGLAPALQSSRPNLTESLKEGGRTGSGASGGRLRKALVISEVSLALVLLVSSALLVQGFRQLAAVDLGFAKDNVLTFRMTLPERGYPDSASVNGFHTRLAPRLAGLPGVSAASATTILPMQGNSGVFYTIPGSEVADESRQPVVSYRSVLPDYFDAMDVPIVSGRDFSESDRIGAPRVLVINQAMAQQHWPNQDPLGQQIAFASGPRQIIGVVGDTREWGLSSDTGPLIFFPALQGRVRSLSFAVRSSVRPTTLGDAVRAEVAALDPNLPVSNLSSLSELVAEQTDDDTIMAKVMAVLGLVALVLSVVGVYGVMAHSVSQRTQEMGIRLALGAQQRSVVSMVVGQGTRLALTGVVIGVIAALGVTKSLSMFLYGVNPFDPVTFATVAGTLVAAGLAATYLPARRATKVDPVVALRTE